MRSELTPGHLGHEFFRPDSALWWLYCALVTVGGIGLVLEVGPGLMSTSFTLWVIAPIFVITLVLFAALVLVTDPYRSRRRWMLFAAAIYGATVATWFSLKANNVVIAVVPRLLGNTEGSEWSAAIAGPTTEEWTKGIGVLLIMLIASRTLTRPMHALLVGGFVGLGFQMVENVLYAANGAASNVNSDLAGALSVTMMRSVIGISSHWLYSAIVGVGVALLLGRVVGARWGMGKRIGGCALLYFLGWGLHFLWNSPLPQNLLAVVIMPAKIVLSIVVLVLVVRFAWRQERAYLAGAQTAIAEGAGADKGIELPAPAVQTGIGTRKERKAERKTVKKASGKAGRKALDLHWRNYLNVLQAWDRRGTGIDEDRWVTGQVPLPASDTAETLS